MIVWREMKPDGLEKGSRCNKGGNSSDGTGMSVFCRSGLACLLSDTISDNTKMIFSCNVILFHFCRVNSLSMSCQFQRVTLGLYYLVWRCNRLV